MNIPTPCDSCKNILIEKKGYTCKVRGFDIPLIIGEAPVLCDFYSRTTEKREKSIQ
jgi:hypothetical protein